MRFSVSMCTVAMTVLGAQAVSGQNYPTHSILFHTTEAGGTNDLAARVIAQGIAASLGVPVVVDNINSVLSGETLARAKPDGYTMSLGSSIIWLSPLTTKAPYDTLRDLAPVSLVFTYPHVLVVHTSIPAHSVKDLIALAKANPGKLNASAAAAITGQSSLSTELFKSMARVNIVRVPYKGNPSALIGLLSGEVDMMFNDWGSVLPHMKSGALRALAVTSLTPYPYTPDLPTMSASGLPGFESILVSGVLVPAGTPPAIVNRLSQEIQRVLKGPEVKEKVPGSEVAGSTPEQFGAKLNSEITKWGKLIRELGLSQD
jgi:tripartite-type tricarboxylate transporter receptor subunit TctC